jgi:acyl dehydratase
MSQGVQQILAEQTAQIGQVLGVSDWVQVDQAQIMQFADATDDHQFIHTDPVRARAETHFGGTIAHGFLTLSLAQRNLAIGVNYGFDKIRFLAPVPAGAWLRGHFTLDAVTQRSDYEILQTLGLRIDIKDSPTPALVAQWLTLLIFTPPVMS